MSRGNLYDRIESRIGHLVGVAVFGTANAGDLLDSAREAAARRLAPWMADSADREQQSSDEAAAAVRERAGRLESALNVEHRWSMEGRASLWAIRKAIGVREDETIVEACERVRGEYARALDACAEQRKRAMNAEAQRAVATADAKRLAGEVERQGRAIADALVLLGDASPTNVSAARLTLRSVAWAEPDAADGKAVLP